MWRGRKATPARSSDAGDAVSASVLYWSLLCRVDRIASLSRCRAKTIKVRSEEKANYFINEQKVRMWFKIVLAFCQKRNGYLKLFEAWDEVATVIAARRRWSACLDRRAGRERVRQSATPRRVCLNLTQGHDTHYWPPHTALYWHQWWANPKSNAGVCLWRNC